MLKEDAEQLLKLLENGAQNAFLISDGVESGIDRAIRVSAAISLQRIAAALEALPDAMFWAGRGI